MIGLRATFEDSVEDQAINQRIAFTYIALFIRKLQAMRSELVVVDILQRSGSHFEVLIIFFKIDILVNKACAGTRERREIALIAVVDHIGNR
jgi:hypothetical protein